MALKHKVIDKLEGLGLHRPLTRLFCLIHSSSSNMMGSTVKVFFSCHISTILVLSHFGWQLVGPIQHVKLKQNSDKTVNWKACKKRTEKTETAVNFVKPKLIWKLQFFLQNRTENRTEVIFCQPHTPMILGPPLPSKTLRPNLSRAFWVI